MRPAQRTRVVLLSISVAKLRQLLALLQYMSHWFHSRMPLGCQAGAFIILKVTVLNAKSEKASSFWVADMCEVSSPLLSTIQRLFVEIDLRRKDIFLNIRVDPKKSCNLRFILRCRNPSSMDSLIGYFVSTRFQSSFASRRKCVDYTGTMSVARQS